jgi:hypothetical protein
MQMNLYAVSLFVADESFDRNEKMVQAWRYSLER